MYRQDTGTLKSKHGYCCLGVLCELGVENKIIPPSQFNTKAKYYCYGDESIYLPPEIVKWCGIKTPKL